MMHRNLNYADLSPNPKPHFHLNPVSNTDSVHWLYDVCVGNIKIILLREPRIIVSFS